MRRLLWMRPAGRTCIPPEVLSLGGGARGPLSKLVDEADSKSVAADPASRFESGEGHWSFCRSRWRALAPATTIRVVAPGGDTFGAVAGQPAHRSFWFDRLRRSACGLPVEDWLIQQANFRGFCGVYLRDPPQIPVEPRLSLEEIVVGLVSPAARLDGRVIKLVTRILQSDTVQVARLLHLARAERAE